MSVTNNIPASVNVAGVQYAVEETSDLTAEQDLLGVVLYSPCKIKLEETMSQTRKEQVFIHEVTHAIFYEAGYTEQDEDQINRVAKVLYQVLKDNELYFGEGDCR